MIPVLSIAALTCLLLIGVVLTKPSIEIKGTAVSLYWIVPLVGALVLIAFNLAPLNSVWHGITADTAINPIKIVVLFLSMTVMSVFLDEIGFFKYLANETLKKAKSNQTVLFVLLYFMVSILTVFTSNDIIILTFTPFICYFTKNANINPIPYLFAEFVAANSWSMALIIGNPTNVYLATANGISFLQYASVMILPTVCAGIVALIILYLLFRKMLMQKITVFDEKVVIEDKAALILGLTHLGLCTVLLTAASYIGIEMWLITLVFAVCLFVIAGVINLIRRDKKIPILHCIRRIPFELVPFVISMFVIVVAMENVGLTTYIAGAFGDTAVIWKYGVASFVSANLVNNIPMSVLFSSIIGETSKQVAQSAVFASVIGSNICAFFTPIGALAGIMWSGILKKHNVHFSFFTYIKYGAVVSIPTLTAALCVLSILLFGA